MYWVIFIKRVLFGIQRLPAFHSQHIVNGVFFFFRRESFSYLHTILATKILYCKRSSVHECFISTVYQLPQYTTPVVRSRWVRSSATELLHYVVIVVRNRKPTHYFVALLIYSTSIVAGYGVYLTGCRAVHLWTRSTKDNHRTCFFVFRFVTVIATAKLWYENQSFHCDWHPWYLDRPSTFIDTY